MRGLAHYEDAVQIPEGINAATPTINPGWNVEKVMVDLTTPVKDSHGNEITERVDQVVYTAKTPLADGYRETFAIQVQLPEDSVGKTLAFPAVQSCEKGETAWVQLAAEGQDSHDLDAPAPTITVTAPEAEGHEAVAETTADVAPAAATVENASLETAAAAPVATVAAPAAESSNGLAIAGLIAGVLGILVGGFALLRGTKKAA